GPASEVSTPQERGLLIGMVGVKGGVGTTTATFNLGLALHQNSQKEVIVAEYSPGIGTIGVELGYKAADGLDRLLERNEFEITSLEIENHLIQFAAGIRLLLASSKPLARLKTASATHYQQITQFLGGMAKFILLDLGASLSPLFQPIYPKCSVIFLLVEPSLVGLSQFHALREALIHRGVHQSRIHALAYNRVRSDIMLTRSQIQERLGIELFGMVTPAPELAHYALLNNRPMYLLQPESITARQFDEVALKILALA
ncbi:MAG: cellulose synthase operon protein YhjQ/BcsQ, partial [Anaerolineales bacterium]|nr:hypothetical protein [Anaerolineales bacterium]MDW8446502.1 cellulose synthase operon protein YhjQ/BcsQ [Anaerolineales bacterium]